MAQFVDWDLAAVTATVLGKTGPKVSVAEAGEAVAELRRLADEAARHVTDFTGLVSKIDHAPIRVVDRRDWTEANIVGLRRVVAPLITQSTLHPPGAIADAVGSRITGVQAGTVLAYLSGKVLGQYEVFSGEPGQLLLVAPNIVEAERRLAAVPRDFRLWVCLHEVTHRAQFTAVPWLRDHFFAEVATFIDAGDGTERWADRARYALGTLAEAARDSDGRTSLLDLVQTPAQRSVLDRITALMTLLEGHAEFVMDEVGPEVVPTVAEIRAKFNLRRHGGNAMEKLLRRLLGVEAKLRQYAEGRRFVHEVVEQVGMAGFNRVWESAQTLPDLAELAEPSSWVDRVAGRPVA